MKDKINYWDLPKGCKVIFDNSVYKLKTKGATFTIGRLIRYFGKNPEIEKYIGGLVNYRNKKYEILIKFPIQLKNSYYAQILALMISEGSVDTEYKLHVPEKEFHDLFSGCIYKIVGKVPIKIDISKDILRSRAPNIIRYLIPIPDIIPDFIFINREFARDYLRVAFEAESYCRIRINKPSPQKFIRFTRNSSAPFDPSSLSYSEGVKITFKRFAQDYPQLAQRVFSYYNVIHQESDMLRNHFGIEHKLAPVSIRINKTDFRCGGKVSIKWNLIIYGKNILKYGKEIGFITSKKKELLEKMCSLPVRNKKYLSLEVMKKISNGAIFSAKDFCSFMKKEGYVHPRVFISRYSKQRLIQKIRRGLYKLI